MKIERIEGTTIAVVTLGGQIDYREVPLDDVFVQLDPAGAITEIEVTDTRRWGIPFDEAAAQRVIEWAREQLATQSAR